MDQELTHQLCIRPPSSTTWVGQRAWVLFGIGLLLNSVLRGIRAPSRYVYTEMLQNYSFGFCKRGLVGTLIAALDIHALYHYSFCFFFCLVLLFFNIAILSDLVRRLCAAPLLTSRFAALIFSSSLAIVVLTHAAGYGDHIGLLVTLLAWRIRGFYVRSVCVATLFTLSILAHETNFVLFFPIILFRFLLDMPVTGSKLAILGVACACVVAALIGVSFAHLSVPSAKALYQSLQHEADYPLRKDEIFAITATFSDFLKSQSTSWNDPTFVQLFLNSLIVSIPTTVFLLKGALLALSEAGRSPLVRTAAALAVLSPLSLHLVAYDCQRWTTAMMINAFLLFATVTLQRRPPTNHEGPMTWRAPLIAVSLIALNLSSTLPLFDGYIVQNFPYNEHLNDFIRMIKGDSRFPPPPALCEESGCLTVTEQLGASKSAVSKGELAKELQRELDAERP